MSAERVLLTYREYEALPADGRRYEIHEGELSVTPAPSPGHQRTLRRLTRVLLEHVEARRIGEIFFAPIDVILGGASVVQPDLVYLDSTRASLVSERGIEGAPTLVVEVLSSSTTLIDRNTKRQLYGRHGIPYYWIVDSEARAVEAYRLASQGEYELLTRASGTQAVALLPFPDLGFIPASLWD